MDLRACEIAASAVTSEQRPFAPSDETRGVVVGGLGLRSVEQTALGAKFVGCVHAGGLGHRLGLLEADLRHVASNHGAGDGRVCPGIVLPLMNAMSFCEYRTGRRRQNQSYQRSLFHCVAPQPICPCAP